MKPQLSSQSKIHTHEDTKKHALIFVLVAAILIGAIFVGFLQLRTPEIVPASAHANEFSADRAFVELKGFANNPHPLGSAEHDKVRDLLVKKLEQLGVQPEIQKANSLRENPKWISGGTVENIVAKIKGTNSTKAVMLVAHYDSVTGGPGAADDGAGVASILETVRALKRIQPLQNDVIILLTDGEENGLLGAKAFVEENPLVNEVGLVLNFEARGNEGPSFMFETSDNNGWLVSEFAKAASNPRAHSFVYNLYKLMPNDTDLTEFKGAGLNGLNFAFAEGLDHYHTTSDNLDKIDLGSIQQHGDYMLSLVRHFGNLDLAQTHKGNQVFFNILGSKMITYSEKLVIPFMLLVLVLFVVTMIHGVRKKKLSISGTLVGLPIFIVGMIGSFVIGMGLWAALTSLFKNQQWLLIGDVSFGKVYLISFTIIVFAFLNTLYVVAHKKMKAGSLTMGAMLVWLLILVASSFLLKAGSYVFTWPLFFGLIGVNLFFLFEERSGKSQVATAVCAIPAFLILAPVIFLIAMLVSMQMTNVLMVLISLLGAMLVPIFCTLKIKSGWVVPSILFAAGVLVLLTNSISLNSMPTAKHQAVSDITYFLDADTKQAYWAARMPLDDHTSNYIKENIKKGNTSEFFPVLNWDVRYAEADTYNLEGPAVNVTSDHVYGDKRTIEYQIHTNRNASEIMMKSLTPMNISELMINGKEVKLNRSKYTKDDAFLLNYILNQTGEMNVKITVDAKDSIKWVVADRSNSIPETKGKMSSKYSTFGDLSFVMRTIQN